MIRSARSPALRGQRQAADPPVVWILDPGGQLLPHQPVRRTAGRGRRDPELLGEGRDGSRVLVGRLELDQDLHLAEGEAALVDHPEHLAARRRPCSGAMKAPSLIASSPAVFAGLRRPLGRCFHYRKGYMLATFSKPQASVTRVTLLGTVPDSHPAAGICWRHGNGEGCPARSRSPLAPLHATARLGGGGAADDRGGRGDRADRLGGASLSGRRLLALVQRPRPSTSGDRRGGARAARPRRPLHDARPLPPRSGRARRAAGRDRALRTEPRLLLRLRVHGGRGRPEDGVPVLAAPRRPARPEDLVHLPRGRLPRGHDRLGLGRRDAPLPLHLRPAALRRPSGEARRCRRHRPAARHARGGGRGGRSRAARAGGGRHAHPSARIPARRPAALRPPWGPADLRRGRDRLRPHGDDVRLRAGGRLARPALRRQGPDRRLSAARRHARDGADLRGVPRRALRIQDLLPRPHLHRQPARLRRGDRLAGRLRTGADPRPAPAEDPAALGVARVRWSGCPRCRRSASAA